MPGAVFRQPLLLEPSFPIPGAAVIVPLSLHDALPISTSFARPWPTADTNPGPHSVPPGPRSEEHTSELQSRQKLVSRLLLQKKTWRTVKIDGRQTHPRQATQIPARSSPSGRSRALRRPLSGHTAPPDETPPLPLDAGCGVPATAPS